MNCLICAAARGIAVSQVDIEQLAHVNIPRDGIQAEIPGVDQVRPSPRQPKVPYVFLEAKKES